MHCSSAGASFLVKISSFTSSLKFSSCIRLLEFSSCDVFIKSADALYIRRCTPIEIFQSLYFFRKIQLVHYSPAGAFLLLKPAGAWLQPESHGDWLFTVGGGRLRLIKSTNGSKVPSSACTRRPDEISTDGNSSKSWPEQIPARGGGDGGGRRRRLWERSGGRNLRVGS
ncbi:hypothetical protein F511_33226 [Dorcoceras hygrometricum]|uniref:Uncharacterized protein n=1 Tax=Dorcoceras hygrometricum TaxID=472368 RepID=A0A2Z7AHS8_9LAMI|nr:hypothetical protein F511_33226 [Dorcoceras hygrometricum]